MSTSSTILDRIRFCVAHGVSTIYEAEAETAYNKAKQLMHKYGYAPRHLGACHEGWYVRLTERFNQAPPVPATRTIRTRAHYRIVTRPAVIITCAECHQEKPVTMAYPGNRPKFCTEECRKTNRNKRAAERMRKVRAQR